MNVANYCKKMRYNIYGIDQTKSGCKRYAICVLNPLLFSTY